MTIVKQIVAVGLLVGPLLACASTSDSDKDDQLTLQSALSKPTVPVSVPSEAPDPDALDRYNIPAGRCGMVLWTLAGGVPVPVFQVLDDGAAEMKIEGETSRLTRQEMAGRSRASMPQIQVFEGLNAALEPLTVEANIVWGNSFPSGSYVERGTITLTGADGWQRVFPVAGIAGCKA